MTLDPLPFDAPLERYEEHAAQLLRAHRAGEPWVIKIIHENHPRFLDDKVRWLPKRMADSEIQSAEFTEADARLALARWYSFLDWNALVAHVAAVTVPDSPTFLFESAVEAVVSGDRAALESLLKAYPELVHARSARITHFDPAVHRGTLLHYIGANGVEGYRQKTPPNAVEIAKTLLDAGSEVDSLASLYGGECTTLSLLVSSCHPAQAGLQVALTETLIDYGAAVDGAGTGNWISPLKTALVFGYRDTAEALVRRGASINDLASAAGLGRLPDARRLLPAADAETRHRALAFAAQLGHADIVALLLDAGEDPNRFNPEGMHAHSTPMHQAALAGHLAVVRLLVERGARTDIEDKLWEGTPLGWAQHGGQKEVEAYLRDRKFS